MQVVVVVNKIDRPAARPDWVVDSTFELFMDLGATDEQCEFPVCYASGVNGIAGKAGVLVPWGGSFCMGPRTSALSSAWSWVLL